MNVFVDPIRAKAVAELPPKRLASKFPVATVEMNCESVRIEPPTKSSRAPGLAVPMPTFIGIVLSPSTMQLLQLTRALAPMAVVLLSWVEVPGPD